MFSEIVLRIDNVGKRYEIYEAPHHRLFQTLLRGRKQFYKEFWALKDVSFKVGKGECLGIIGRNGSGKSTLLQIIAGTLAPTTGSVKANGNIAALLELGSGFNPEFTGRENVRLNGAIVGLSKNGIDEKIENIAAFADIGEFFDQPVKTYSSGMYVRLAFAAAISVDPHILIIDEALAVGDIRFQQKCFRKLKEFKDRNKTILFISHDLSAVETLCDRALWLDCGKIQCDGIPEAVAKKYIWFMSYGFDANAGCGQADFERASSSGHRSVQNQDIQWETTARCESFGEGGAAVVGTALYSKKTGMKIAAFEGGEDVAYYIKIIAKQRIESPIVGFILNDDHGVNLLGCNSRALKTNIQPFEKDEIHIFRFEFRFPCLRPGNYLFSPAIANGTQMHHMQIHWVYDAYMVQIVTPLEVAQLGSYLVPDNIQFMQDE